MKTDFKAAAPWRSEISYCYYYCVMRTMMFSFFGEHKIYQHPATFL